MTKKSDMDRERLLTISKEELKDVDLTDLTTESLRTLARRFCNTEPVKLVGREIAFMQNVALIENIQKALDIPCTDSADVLPETPEHDERKTSIPDITEEQPKSAPLPKAQDATDSLADAIAKAIQGKVIGNIDANAVNQIVTTRLKADVFSKLEAIKAELAEKALTSTDIEEIVKATLSTVKAPITVVDTTGKETNAGLQHSIFPSLLKLAANRMDTFIVGPAGSGKTFICHAIAKALDIPFYTLNVGAQTTQSNLLGYMSASGAYVPTMLRTAYENGGLFLLDEIDAGNANVLTCINAMLANGEAGFPDGMIKRHKDFIFFCAGNTYGRGADKVYVGRNQLDGASLDRFTQINMDYDENLEMALSSNEEWTRKVQAIRNIVFDLKEKIVISPRASIKGATLLQAGFSLAETLDMVIFKGINNEVKQRILNNLLSNR